VQWKTETQLRVEYGDVLGSEVDAALLRVAQDLDAGLHAVDPPPALWSAAWRLPEAAAGSGPCQPAAWLPRGEQDRPLPPPTLTTSKPGGSDPSVLGGDRKWRVHTKLYAAFTLVAACAILLATSVTMAGPTQASITNLGPPLAVQSTNAAFPLSGFHRTNTSLSAHRLPVILFIGTLAGPIGVGTFNVFDHKSAVERWPVIKALDQFGSLTGVRPAPSLCQKDAPTRLNVCQVATYDWSHAGYRSRYLVFDHKDLLDRRDRPLQTLSPAERALYSRYSRDPGQFTFFPGKPDYVVSTVENSNSPGGATSTRQLPLLLVGNYLQTVSQITISGDFEETLTSMARDDLGNVQTVQSGVSFATVQKALLHSKNPRNTQLIPDVNAEANIITALICHATKNQPTSVCNRPTIKQILKSVK